MERRPSAGFSPDTHAPSSREDWSNLYIFSDEVFVCGIARLWRYGSWMTCTSVILCDVLFFWFAVVWLLGSFVTLENRHANLASYAIKMMGNYFGSILGIFWSFVHMVNYIPFMKSGFGSLPAEIGLMCANLTGLLLFTTTTTTQLTVSFPFLPLHRIPLPPTPCCKATCRYVHTCVLRTTQAHITRQ